MAFPDDDGKLQTQVVFNELLANASPEAAAAFIENVAPALAKAFAPRVLSNGSDVTTLSDASAVWGGPSRFNIFNFKGGAVVHNKYDRNQADIFAGAGADCMFNYLVSSCAASLAGFSEGMSITSLSGCTFKMYSKLFGTGYALADAQATGGTLEIYICGSETITSAHSLDTWKASADTNIIIEGPGGIGLKNRRVTLTATNCHLVQGISQATGATLGASSLLFKNVDITVTGAFGVTAIDAEGVNRPLKFWFEHVNFTVTLGYLYTNLRGRPTLDYELQQCTGTINQFYRYANGGSQTGFGDLTLRQCAITCAVLFDQGTTKIIPNFFFYDSDLTLTAALSWTQTAGSDPQWYWDGLFVYYTGGNSTTCLSGQVGSFSALGTTRIDFRDVTFFTGYTNVKFLNFTASAAGDSDSLIKFASVRGFSSAGQAVTFITVDTGLTRTEAGVILANQWSTVYSGPVGSGPLISGVIVQDDDVTVEANAQTLDFGSGLVVTSSPAGEANIVASYAAPVTIGLANATGAAATVANSAHVHDGLGDPQALTGAVAATRYVGATASGAPVAGPFEKGDFIVAQDGKIWICTVAGSPGTWTQVGASSAVAHELVWYSQTPVTGDNLAYIPIRFNGVGATGVTPLQVRAKDYGYGTTKINLLRAVSSGTVGTGLPNPTFATVLTSDLNVESSHITFSGLEDVTITLGALASTTFAFDDMLRVDYDAVVGMVDAAVELTVTV